MFPSPRVLRSMSYMRNASIHKFSSKFASRFSQDDGSDPAQKIFDRFHDVKTKYEREKLGRMGTISGTAGPSNEHKSL
jgi:hypothetical protein